MARKVYPYSLDRRDAKIAGVCSALGARWGIDPTIIRIAWIAVPLLTPVDFTTALVAYAIIGLVLAFQKRKALHGDERLSEFDRMDRRATVRPTVHAARTELDVTDRRLMAIDDHLNSPNHELAREIEALREEK